MMVVFIVTASVDYFGNANTTIPQQTPGMLDFSGYSFTKEGIANLNGEWEFYWNRLLGDTVFKTRAYTPDLYARVPDNWNSYNMDGKGLPGFGYATYRLRMEESGYKAEY